MFLTTGMFFFYPLDIELQHVRSDKNSILWFSFLLHLKRRPQFPRLSSPSQSTLYICPLNQRKACSRTWFSYVLLQLLPALSILLLDGQLLILRQLHWHVHVSEFFYPVEFNRAKKPTLEDSAWTGCLNLSSLSLISFSELNKALDTN